MPNSNNKTAFIERLQSGNIILLDGGLSNQLEAQGVDLNHSLWSAVLLDKNQQQIIDAHRYYLEAGADCIITSSYQASEIGFKAAGIKAERGRQLLRKSVAIAQTAIDDYLSQHTGIQRPMVAASIGPYGAALADGSEYHGQYNISDDQLTEFHQQRLAILDNTDADILACETIPSLQEARVLQQLLLSVNTPAWISFSCQDGQSINDGSAIEDCAKLFNEHPKVLAIGINCTAPQHVNELIKRIKDVAPGKAIVVYPNSGENYNAETKTWHGTSTPESAGMAAQSWIAAGASIIGGCCRMGPEHIRQMRQQCGDLLKK